MDIREILEIVPRHIKIYKCQQCICFNSWRNDEGELIYTCNVNGKKIDNPQEIAAHCEGDFDDV